MRLSLKIDLLQKRSTPSTSMGGRGTDLKQKTGIKLLLFKNFSGGHLKARLHRPFLSQQNRIRFQTCSKPLRYRGVKSHLVYTCDFEAATLARQKLHRVATKIACVNGPRTQKAAGPSQESIRNHPAWFVILELSGGVYSTYF